MFVYYCCQPSTVETMMRSTIGRCAVFLLLLKLGTSPPPAAADQSFRGSRRHRTMDDDCASFTAKISCLAGTGECIWHPQNGCVSATSTTETSERVFLTGGEVENSGDDEARTMKVSRKLQGSTRLPTSKPTTRSPTKPTTRQPTSKPTPKSKPTTRSPVSLQCFVVIICLPYSHRSKTCSTLLIHRHPN